MSVFCFLIFDFLQEIISGRIWRSLTYYSKIFVDIVAT